MPSPLESRLLSDINAILGPSGLITQGGRRRLRHNAQQFEYAQRVAKGLLRFDAATGKTAINLQQAATGTGKTLGYLVPLMLFSAYGKGEVARVAVSTFTRHLQKQILAHDAPAAADWVEKITGVRLSIALRMGIGNFVSAVATARLRDVLDQQNDKRFDEAISFLDDLIEWADATDSQGKPLNSGLLHDFLEDHELGYLPFGVTANAVALDHNAPEDEKSAYLSMVSASKDADVLVVNHSLLITNAMRWAALLDDPDKRPITALVCDEADRLPTAAEGVTGAGLPLHKMAQACQAMGDEKAVAAVSRLQAYVDALKVPSISAMAIDNRSEMSVRLQATLQILRPIGITCAHQVTTKSVTTPELLRLTNFLDVLAQAEATLTAIGDRESSAILSWSPVRAFPALRVGHHKPGRILSRLWNLRRDTEDKSLPPTRGYLDAVLLTSATLETPGRPLPRAFDEFASDVGAIRHVGTEGSPVHNMCTDLFARFEPSRFGQMRIVLTAPGTPLPSIRNDDSSWDTRPEWLDYAAAMVRAAHAAGGRTLVLALSWRDAAALGKRLSDIGSLIAHTHGQPLREAVASYVATENAVLITPSAWEGVDLPGLVQQLVITRIPFAPSDDAVTAHRHIHYEHLGFSKDKINAILYNDAESATRRKLAQGIGRGLRAFDDDVTLWVADPRFPLPESFADSLDPILLDAPSQRVRISLRHCIPQRFLETTYPQARLFLKEGQLHTPCDLA